ncbi:hypothetical protein [Eubacterium sp.]|uniref:hypothetical protein n=1 Tax=Eubacterium sp. TaxID=142586 RepID=UPI0026DF7FB1|nr:hypothetical protein [Eubacterium sp.]MDO5433339.1 hypothetical protein [Eubacterium sp.]
MRIITQNGKESLEFSQVSLEIIEKTETTCEIIAKGQDYRQTVIGEYDRNEVDEQFARIHAEYEAGCMVYWMPEA